MTLGFTEGLAIIASGFLFAGLLDLFGIWDRIVDWLMMRRHWQGRR